MLTHPEQPLILERHPEGVLLLISGTDESVFLSDAHVCDLMEAIRENHWCFRRREASCSPG